MPERHRHLPRKSQTWGWVPAKLHSHTANHKRHFRGSLCTGSILLSVFNLKKKQLPGAQQDQNRPIRVILIHNSFYSLPTSVINQHRGRKSKRIWLKVTTGFSTRVAALHAACPHSEWDLSMPSGMPTTESSSILF